MQTIFDHENLRVYQCSIRFLAWLEEVSSGISSKMSACDHLARASASVPVNIAEASGKRSMNERRQYIATAYGSSLECAACLDILCILECLQAATVDEGKGRLSTLVSMLIGFRKSTGHAVREESVAYAPPRSQRNRVWFDHEKMDVYRKALAFVAWCGRLRNGASAPWSTAMLLDKASTGVVLNIAEGNGKFSVKDRCRFISHARTAALQAAATLDVLAVRQVTFTQEAAEGKRALADVVCMLVAWEKKLKKDDSQGSQHRTRTPTRTPISPRHNQAHKTTS